jgi:hypothetical protein
MSAQCACAAAVSSGSSASGGRPARPRSALVSARTSAAVRDNASGVSGAAHSAVQYRWPASAWARAACRKAGSSRVRRERADSRQYSTNSAGLRGPETRCSPTVTYVYPAMLIRWCTETPSRPSPPSRPASAMARTWDRAAETSRGSRATRGEPACARAELARWRKPSAPGASAGGLDGGCGPGVAGPADGGCGRAVGGRADGGGGGEGGLVVVGGTEGAAAAGRSVWPEGDERGGAMTVRPWGERGGVCPPSSVTRTPKSRASPASPSAYPCPIARTLQPVPGLRYSSASSSTVSGPGRGGAKRATVRPEPSVTSSRGAGSRPSGVPGSAALTTTVTRQAPPRSRAGSTARVSPRSRTPAARGWL